MGQDRAIVGYDLETGEMRFRLPQAAAGVFRGASGDGRWIVTRIPASPSIEIRDGRNGHIAGRIPLEFFNSAVFNHDGSRLVTTTFSSKAVQVWSIPEGAPITKPLTSEHGMADFACFSPDGSLIAATYGDGAEILDATTGSIKTQFLRHAGRSTMAQFTPDNRRLVTVSQDRTAKVWEVSTGELALPPLVHGAAVVGGFISTDGRRLATVSSDQARQMWDLATGQLVGEPSRPRKGELVVGAADGELVVRVTADGRFDRFHVEATSLRPLALSGTENRLGSAWLRDSPSTLRWVTETRLATIDAVSGREVVGGFVFPEPIASYAMARGGGTMLVRTKTGKRQAWQIEGERVHVATLERLSAGALLPRSQVGGELAAGTSGGVTGELRLWNLKTGKLLDPVMPYASRVVPNSIRFSLDGKSVGAGTLNGEAKIWEVATGRLVHDLKPIRGGVQSLDFSPDGNRIATGHGRGGRLWDATSGKPVGDQLFHAGQRIEIGDFSDDGKWLLTYAPDGGSVRVWSAHSGAPLGWTIEHSASISRPVFSPDGMKIATACGDGSVRLWDTRTGSLISEPMPHGADVISVTFSRDGHFIRTNCADKRVRIWAVPSETGVRAPEWLLRLATICAGKSVTDDGATVDAAAELVGYGALRAEVSALPAGAPFAAWGKWFFGDPAKRTLAPGFEITVAEAEARGMIAPLAITDPDATAPAPLN